MKKVLLLFLLFASLAYGRFEFDIRYNAYYTPQLVYDILLPYLMRFKITDKNDDDYTRLEKMIRHINFYATPGKYEKFDGLGTNGSNFHNASLMMAAGDMACSEQATLAVQAFADKFEQSRLDVVGHTLGELRIGNRWVLVDPMFDLRIKNKEGLPASFGDILHYVQGDPASLRLPQHLLPRTEHYLARYKKERFIAAPNAPRKTFFGNRHTSPKQQTKINIGLNPDVFINAMRQQGIDFNREFTPHYPSLYIIPNILYILEQSKNPKAQADLIQDRLLEAIRRDFPKSITLAPELYFARQYQIMQRYDKALTLYDRMEQTERIKFYKAQIFFKTNNKPAFAAYRKELGEDTYYKYMYYKLFGRFLYKTDKKLLEEFKFKHYYY